jgi:hypothetical protein
MMLASHVPYSAKAAERYVQRPSVTDDDALITSAVSEDTVRLLTHAAYREAKLLQSDQKPIALACTAALQTDRVRRGRDHAWIGIEHPLAFGVREVDLTGGDRNEQEERLSAALLETLTIAVDWLTSADR